MLNWGANWTPMLIFPIVVLSAFAVMAFIMTRTSRPPGHARWSPMCESSHGERIYDRSFARGLDNHPLNILRARYARGEIGHAEYERTLETLLRNGQTASRARPEGEY